MRSANPEQGSGGFSALPFSDFVNSKALAAGVNEDITVPDGAYFAIFSGSVNFYAKPGGTAAVPTDITNGSASILNPYIVAVTPGQVIGLIAAADCLVTISYYGKG